MSQNLVLLSQGLTGLAEPLSPDELSGLHPLWAADVEALGPWRLEPGPEPLGPVWRAQGGQGEPVVLCGPCASSMDVARHLAGLGALSAWGSVLATDQTSGRGQLRRAWLSRPGNVLGALVCPQETGAWNDLRPLVLGYLLAEGLSALGQPVQVKWPNDLLSRDLKVAGMLVEERAGCVLAGVGINLAWAPPPAALRDGHSVAAGQYCASDGGLGPLGLWHALVNQLKTRYRTLLETFSPSEFLTIFRSRLAWMGRRVLVQEGASIRYEAVVRGISAEGGLVLDRAGQEVVLLAGDVIPV